MSWHKTDHQQRKDIVLGLVVDEYIKTVTPVSSGHIARRYIRDLSPATIRNILAELEREGLLMHPHTSAGRVPTQDGYRYYVDNLMSEIQILKQEKVKIKSEYATQVKDLEGILEKTSQVLSDLTHYTSIISIDGGDRIFCKGVCHVVGYPEYQDLTKIRDILQALEEKERLLDIINQEIRQKIQIYIGHETAFANIQNCSLAISPYRTKDNARGRIAILGPTHMDYPRVVSMLDYFSRLMEEITF